MNCVRVAGAKASVIKEDTECESGVWRDQMVRGYVRLGPGLCSKDKQNCTEGFKLEN